MILPASGCIANVERSPLLRNQGARIGIIVVKLMLIIPFVLCSTVTVLASIKPNIDRCQLAFDSRNEAVNNVLAEFPNVTIPRGSATGDAESFKGKFLETIVRKVDGLQWYSWEQITGGRPSVDPQQLVGKTVAAYADAYHIDFNNEGMPLFNAAAGVVRQIQGIHARYIQAWEITLETPEGERSIKVVPRSTDHYFKFYVLGNTATSQEIMASAVLNAGLLEDISKIFNSPLVAEDLAAVIDIVNLYESLPASHGVASVCKTLRGSSNATKSNPLFGKYAEHKRYSAARIKQITELLERFLESQRGSLRTDIEYDESINREDRAPDFIRHRHVNATVINHLRQVFEFELKQLIDQSGVSLQVAEAPVQKPLTAKDINKLAAQFIREKWDTAKSEEAALLLRRILGSRYKETSYVQHDTSGEIKRIKTGTSKGISTILYKLPMSEINLWLASESYQVRSFAGVAEVKLDKQGTLVDGPKFYWAQSDRIYSLDGIQALLPAGELEKGTPLTVDEHLFPPDENLSQELLRQRQMANELEVNLGQIVNQMIIDAPKPKKTTVNYKQNPFLQLMFVSEETIDNNHKRLIFVLKGSSRIYKGDWDSILATETEHQALQITQVYDDGDKPVGSPELEWVSRKITK